MYGFLIDEINKLNPAKTTKEKIASVTMGLEKKLEKYAEIKPPRTADEYSAWEERYYEIKHLIEYADAAQKAVKGKNNEKIAESIEDFKQAARDFQMIYGGLEK
jgi:hypothetical protein